LAQPAPRARAPFPLSLAQAAQLRAPAPPLMVRPHPSATRLPPSRAATSPWQLGPACQLRRSRPCLTGAFTAERLTPRRLAIKACTGLSDHPATVPEPSPHPSPARAVPIAVSSIPAIMASSSALVVPSIPLPGAYKRSRPSPVLSTLAPTNSSASPRANQASAAVPPVAPVSPISPFPVIISPINQCAKLRHTLTVTRHPSPPPIAPGILTGDLTAVDTRHHAADRPP
jgi:hypothetical protein